MGYIDELKAERAIKAVPPTSLENIGLTESQRSILTVIGIPKPFIGKEVALDNGLRVIMWAGSLHQNLGGSAVLLASHNSGETLAHSSIWSYGVTEPNAVETLGDPDAYLESATLTPQGMCGHTAFNRVIEDLNSWLN